MPTTKGSTKIHATYPGFNRGLVQVMDVFIPLQEHDKLLKLSNATFEHVSTLSLNISGTLFGQQLWKSRYHNVACSKVLLHY